MKGISMSGGVVVVLSCLGVLLAPAPGEAESADSAATTAEASSPENDSPGEDEGPPVFRGELDVKDQAERSKTTTVLTREELEGEHAANLNDYLFSGIPGVATARRTNFGFSGPGAGFSIRGLSNPHVAVFVDGIPNQINSHFHPRTDQYSPDLIDRIEIIRGPSAVEHGPSAVGGVIQIYTRRPPKGFSGSVQALAGELGTTEFIGDLGYGWEGGHLLVSGVDRESDASEQLGEHFIEENLNLKLSQRLTDTWTFGFRYSNTDEPPSDQFGSDPDQVFFRFIQDLSTYVLSLNRRTDQSGSVIAVYSNELDAGSFRESINGGQFLRRDRIEEEQGVWLRHTWQLASGNSLTAGLEAVEYSDENPTGSPSLSESFVSPSFSFNRKLGEATSLDGGLRLTDSSQFGSDLSPELGVRHSLRPDLTVRARAGKAFRVPRVSEVFAPVPTPDLEPEDFLHAELGLNKRFEDRAVLDVAVWWMDGDNLIQRIGSGPTTQNVNTGSFSHTGLESTLNVRLTDRIGLLFGVALLDVSEGIQRVPQQTFDAGVDAKIGAFRARVVFRHAADNSTPTLGDYLVGDARLSYEVVDGLAVLLDVINLTDEAYATTTGFGGPIPQPGRTVLGGLRFGWGR